jgi:hypothetical protein
MTFITLKAYISVITLITVFILLSGCEPKDDPNLVPSYLHIEKIDLLADFSQGSASSNISDAWVYIDDQLIGSFELPVTIPILTQGKQNLVVRAGIKLNGIGSTRSAYPFFTEIKREVNFVRDSVITLNDASVNYHSNVVFPWIENFELAGLSLDTTSKSTVNISKTGDPSKILPGYGDSFAGIVQLTAESSVFEVSTKEKFIFPGNGSSIFLEMDYKINHPMVVGVFYTTSGMRVQRPLIVLNETEGWKKVYVNLSVPKYDTPNATDFQVFFGAQKETTTGDAVFLYDNLKLVHFNTTK